MKWRWTSWRCLLVATLLVVNVAMAHEARPIAIEITQLSNTHYHYSLRVPASVDLDNRPTLQWPSDCKVEPAAVQCGDSLERRLIKVVWPLYNPSVTVLMRYLPREGEARTAVLTPGINEWLVPATATLRSTAKGYFELGVRHILGGMDHLLFVAGLLLIARGARGVVVAISGFTLAHSLTLSLAALGYVRVPIAPTEAAIALSIIFLAREAASLNRATVTHRYPLVVSATFGLLHGLGFAAALAEVGLPKNEMVWSLLFFNVGVEAGQLMFVLCALGTVALVKQSKFVSNGSSLPQFNWTSVASYALGIPAAYWFFARMLVMVKG